MLAGHLERVELTLGETLHRAGDTIDSVYFVESGFISALAMLSDGSAAGNRPDRRGRRRRRFGHARRDGIRTAKPCVRPAATPIACPTPRSRKRSSTRRTCATCCCATCTSSTSRSRRPRPATRTTSLGQRLARWLLAAHDRSGVRGAVAHAGSDRRHARRASLDGQHRRRHAAEGRRHPLSARPDHHRRPGRRSRTPPANATRRSRASIAACSASIPSTGLT